MSASVTYFLTVLLLAHIDSPGRKEGVTMEVTLHTETKRPLESRPVFLSQHPNIKNNAHGSAKLRQYGADQGRQPAQREERRTQIQKINSMESHAAWMDTFHSTCTLPLPLHHCLPLPVFSCTLHVPEYVHV